MTALMKEALQLIRSGAEEASRLNPITPPSDQSIRWKTERHLQNALFDAIQNVKIAVDHINKHSEVMSINIGGFEDWLHDEGILDRGFWDHKISEAGER